MTWSPVSPGESRSRAKVSTEYPKGPRGKGGKQTGKGDSPGKRHIPPLVKATAVALLEAGEMKQAEIARGLGISRDLVHRLALTADDISRADVAAITKGLPAMLKVATAQFAEKTIELLSEGKYGDATKTMFGAKLGTEATRWAQPASETAGGTVLNFIEALGQAGGGTLTVGPALPRGPEPTPDPLIETTAEVVE